METGGLNQVASAPFDASKRATGPGQLDIGKNDFLHLLTKQLAAQDPLNPSDSTAFLSQLAQFSSLEQMANISEGIDLLGITQTAGTSAQMVSFIGKKVEFNADTLFLDQKSDNVDLTYKLADDAYKTTVVIKNEDGEVVRTYELGPQSEGSQTLSFDGRDEEGNTLPEGIYNFHVAAKDEKSNEIVTTTKSKGIVEAVQFENGYPQLLLQDGRVITLNQLMSVHQNENLQSAWPSAATLDAEFADQAKTNTSLLDMQNVHDTLL